MDEIHPTLMMILQLVASVVLVLPVAWDREHEGPSMGLRTFSLVSLGSCAYVLIGLSLVSTEEHEVMIRLLQGLMSGIGFVGGGAIIKDSDHVRGTASAASIWVTGALGAATGFQLWGLAVALSIANFGVIVVMTRVKRAVK
ncbi:MgtC/SapB family protein [Granulosicoccus sp. 3-233]|uniref:MgtC/SapB family protein n=1 Tax=Granulosicoccus sp. 3-233 TaxID=3417969 RepID=UPI003D335A98